MKISLNTKIENSESEIIHKKESENEHSPLID